MGFIEHVLQAPVSVVETASTSYYLFTLLTVFHCNEQHLFYVENRFVYFERQIDVVNDACDEGA